MMLPKYSPWTEHFNAIIAKLRAGGLIKYYWDDPLSLEFTLDDKLFNYVDDSQDKLTPDTFFLLFLIWAFGMVLSFFAISIEILYFRRNMKHKVKILTKKTRFAN